MNRLREHRKRAGLSLDALARAVGSRKAYMWQLENKVDPDPGIKLAFSIASVLRAPVQDIFNVKARNVRSTD